MESTLLYHMVEPEALQSAYVEFNNCDFVVNVGQGRSLVKNSIRICGDVKITSDGTAQTTGQIYWDFRIGANSFIDSIQVSFGGPGGGIKENIQNYGRWCEMTAIASLNEDDYLNASQQVELRAPNKLSVERLADGEITIGTTPVNNPADFALKPICILNKMVGDHLPFEKSGEIRLTLNLARNQSALQGSAQGQLATYELSNLRCHYQSVEHDENWASTDTKMRSVYNVKSSIQSGSANVQAQVPAVCDSVSCSFQRQNTENVNVLSNYDCQQVQNISNVQFLWNSSTNQYITYEMNDQNDMLHRYIDSFLQTGHNQVMLDTFRGNAGFGLGIHFGEFTDLSRQNFSLQLKSSITNIYPYNVYMYFHSLIEV